MTPEDRDYARRWSMTLGRMRPEALEQEDMCDSCERFLADYIVGGVSTPYDGSQWASILCGGCARKEAKRYGLQGPWEKS